MGLNYKCPECGTALGFEGLCWSCRASCLPLPARCGLQRGHASAPPGRQGAGHLHGLPHRHGLGLRLPGAEGPEGEDQKFVSCGDPRLLCQRLYQHCAASGGAGAGPGRLSVQLHRHFGVGSPLLCIAPKKSEIGLLVEKEHCGQCFEKDEAS